LKQFLKDATASSDPEEIKELIATLNVAVNERIKAQMPAKKKRGKLSSLYQRFVLTTVFFFQPLQRKLRPLKRRASTWITTSFQPFEIREVLLSLFSLSSRAPVVLFWPPYSSLLRVTIVYIFH